MIFLLSIRFLDGRYHGTTNNGDSTEWPPSPFRVFQALVNGNVRGDKLPDDVRKALLWLERLNPPDIIAPPGHDGTTQLTYVLNNVSDTNPNSRAPKTLRPTILGQGDDARLVDYVWRYTESSDAQESVKTLNAASRRIRAVGWGIDLAIGYGTNVDSIPETSSKRFHYKPTQMQTLSGIERRVPRAGSLCSLEETYRQFLSRNATPGQTHFESACADYNTIIYAAGFVRPSVAFRLVNADDDSQSIRVQKIKALVGMIRNLANHPRLIELYGKDAVNHDLKGHPKSGSINRVSILPLPSARTTGHVDGRIRRVMLAQPTNSDGALCMTLVTLFDGIELIPDDTDSSLVGLHLKCIRNRDPVLPLYTRSSYCWASITPVLLPGYDDRKNHRGNHIKRLERAESLVEKALDQSGLPRAKNIQLSKVPFHVGSLHVRDYLVRDKLSMYPRWHVLLQFPHPIPGPIAIGAGRHCGFGLMAAVGD